MFCITSCNRNCKDKVNPQFSYAMCANCTDCDPEKQETYKWSCEKFSDIHHTYLPESGLGLMVKRGIYFVIELFNIEMYCHLCVHVKCQFDSKLLSFQKFYINFMQCTAKFDNFVTCRFAIFMISHRQYTFITKTLIKFPHFGNRNRNQ